MRSRGNDVNEGDGRSEAGSSRNEEETHSRHGSQRSGKSSRNNEELNYGSEDSSSKNTSGNNNPIEYTEQERAELLRRLDSIKDHLLRGGGGNAADKPKEAFLRPQPYYQHPYPYAGPMYPQGYHQDPYGRPPPVPNPNWYPPPHYPRAYPGGGGQYVEIGADIVEPHSYYPATPSRYGGDMPPYSPVSSHNRGGGAAPYSPSYARWPSDLDSEMGGGAFARGYVKKAVSDRDARRCHPLSGGAPFIACHSCFELLYLPKKKLLAQERKLHKLQCGSCSQVISFRIVNKKLVFSSGNEEANAVSLPEVEDRIATNNTMVVEGEEEEAIKESRNHQETTQSVGSASTQFSDDEERSSISCEQQQKEVKSVRRRSKGSKSPEPAASESASLLELFEYSNVNRAALAYGMAELGYHKPVKKEFLVKQDSPKKPESVATETEVSYNGYSNTEVSEDSMYSNGREDNNNNNNNTERSSSEDQEKLLEVWVNGHLIPEDLVSSAEKLAGPIQAGKYWYDYRAGFWGVMDKPCLGIIPPFIEEFSHPMPDRCAAGSSEVYVNGRELHKRDFELLVGRGLPRDKNRSYILDISGRILDGDSGEELKSLGKLAPTIEKVKHGFGMRVPRSLAS